MIRKHTPPESEKGWVSSLQRRGHLSRLLCLHAWSKRGENSRMYTEENIFGRVPRCMCLLCRWCCFSRKKMHEAARRVYFYGGRDTLQAAAVYFPPVNPDPLLLPPSCTVHGRCPALPCPTYLAFSWRCQATQWWRWKLSWTARASAPCPRQAKRAS